MKFATDGTTQDKKPVLLEIEWKGRMGAFRMNSKDYSAIPTEQEILLGDGVDVIVKNVIENDKK